MGVQGVEATYLLARQSLPSCLLNDKQQLGPASYMITLISNEFRSTLVTRALLENEL